MKKKHLNIKNFFNKKIFIDSREVKENSIFICIKGEKKDGHSFAKKILKNFLNVIVVCEKKTKYLKNIKKYKNRIVLCDSTISYMQDFAKIKRLLLNNSLFIGITGSSGKTTLKETVFNCLSAFNKSYRSKKSFNNHIGLPFTLINQNQSSKFNIYELGMNKLGEINFLSKILKPNIAVITNIGEAHLGKLGSVKAIAKAKSEIIKNIEYKGLIILNRDCNFFNYFKKIAKEKKLNILTFGKNKNANIFYRINNKGNYDLFFRNKKIFSDLLILNINQINNIMICALLLFKLQLNLKKGIRKIQNFSSLKGRGNIVKKSKKITLIDDSYNSNPISLKSSLDFLSEYKNNSKKIAVIGDMLELGKFSKKKHEDIGKYINAINIDKVYTIGKESKKIFYQLDPSKRGSCYKNIKAFQKEFDKLIVANSVILFKASNSIGLYKFLNNKIY